MAQTLNEWKFVSSQTESKGYTEWEKIEKKTVIKTNFDHVWYQSSTLGFEFISIVLTARLEYFSLFCYACVVCVYVSV
jgi:hypothetical protein